MEKFLILYGTTEGHTQKVAGHIAEVIRGHGSRVELIDCDAWQGQLRRGDYRGVILGGSIHGGTHQSALRRFVRHNREVLNQTPSAFFSVSIHAALPDEANQQEARRYVDRFLEETGWEPDETWCVAGALRFTRYDYFKRLVMRMIARRGGYDVEATKDFEYTDWGKLTVWVEIFLADLTHTYAKPATPTEEDA